MEMTDERFERWNDHSCKVKDNYKNALLNWEDVVKKLNEQQATIDEIEKNFDDLVKWASKIANRNVILDEQIGQLQRENEQLRQLVKEYRKTNKHLSELCADASKNGYLPPLEDLR